MVNMNMIVNKSDLVGYEAVETKAAKKEALAKLVAAKASPISEFTCTSA